MLACGGYASDRTMAASNYGGIALRSCFEATGKGLSTDRTTGAVPKFQPSWGEVKAEGPAGPGKRACDVSKLQCIIVFKPVLFGRDYKESQLPSSHSQLVRHPSLCSAGSTSWQDTSRGLCPITHTVRPHTLIARPSHDPHRRHHHHTWRRTRS